MSLLLGACQLLPGDGPKMSRAVPDVQAPLPYDVIDLDPTSVLPYRTAVRPDGPSVARSASAGRKVSVQPGDVLKVRVLEPYEGGIFPTAQKAGADLGTQRVTDAGTISVPFVGAVEVRGLDLGQVEQRILERLKGRAQEPQVIVELVSDRSNTIMVSGDVKTPGRFSVLDGTRSVADAINRAGGPASSDNLSSPQFEVVLRQIVAIVEAEMKAGTAHPISDDPATLIRTLAGTTALVLTGDPILVGGGGGQGGQGDRERRVRVLEQLWLHALWGGDRC